eukprot:3696389-Amphidinium_carterae.2
MHTSATCTQSTGQKAHKLGRYLHAVSVVAMIAPDEMQAREHAQANSTTGVGCCSSARGCRGYCIPRHQIYGIPGVALACNTECGCTSAVARGGLTMPEAERTE